MGSDTHGGHTDWRGRSRESCQQDVLYLYFANQMDRQSLILHHSHACVADTVGGIAGASGGWQKDIEGRAARNRDEQPWYGKKICD